MAWSPDRTRLALSRDDHIRLIKADGTGLTRRTSGEPHSGPSWSPDGTRIAFSRSFANQVVELRVVNVDGSNPVRVSDPCRRDSASAWSPDGTRIAFFSDAGFSFPQVEDPRLMLMNPDGSGRTTVRQGRAIAPSWSPDGSRIAYATVDADGIINQIFSVAPDGSGDTQLTTAGRNANPAWR